MVEYDYGRNVTRVMTGIQHGGNGIGAAGGQNDSLFGANKNTSRQTNR